MPYKRTVRVDGKYKDIIVVNGVFYETESGEAIDVVGQIEAITKGEPFSLAVLQKNEVELDEP